MLVCIDGAACMTEMKACTLPVPLQQIWPITARPSMRFVKQVLKMRMRGQVQLQIQVRVREYHSCHMNILKRAGGCLWNMLPPGGKTWLMLRTV